MKNYSLFIFYFLCNLLFGQEKPNYPKVPDNYKRVDFILPKIDDNQKYLVEITFSKIANVVNCANANFILDKSDIKTGYGIPPSRFQYYIIEVEDLMITQGFNIGCNNKDPKEPKKIYSTYKFMEEYNSTFIQPYYIPEDWNLEYKIYKAETDFTTF